MVLLGILNVGKSAIINTLAARSVVIFVCKKLARTHQQGIHLK
ncbi:hypothetical protein [Candidatus Photodesmus blepharus]|nr:hypothetical protein [Candidatus Photodesmus blepharus]